MSSVGLFFGSFNPIHNGHLAIACYLLEHGYCEKVWFVISPQNPWKKDKSLLDEQKRLLLVERVIAGDTRMEVCDIEFRMPRPSYTYQTLRVLKEEFPAIVFSLIIGGDNLRNFHLWKDYKNILARFPVLVYPRPHVRIPDVPEDGITIVDAPVMSISSTEIRKKVKAGEAISECVPDSILSLIQEYYSR